MKLQPGNLPRLVAALLLSLLLSACVGTRVSGLAIGEPTRVQELEVAIRYGTFTGGSKASNLGQRNLGNIVPHLRNRLPEVFSLNGVPTRMKETATLFPEAAASAPSFLAKLLVITPESAAYNSRSGQTLTLGAEIIDPVTQQKLWQGHVSMSTPGFSSFDQDLANTVSAKLLDQLRHDKMVRLSHKEIRTQ